MNSDLAGLLSFEYAQCNVSNMDCMAIVFHHITPVTVGWYSGGNISTSQSDQILNEHILWDNMWCGTRVPRAPVFSLSDEYDIPTTHVTVHMRKWLGYRPRHDTIQHLSISMRLGPHRSSLCERQMRRSLFEHHSDLGNMFAHSNIARVKAGLTSHITWIPWSIWSRSLCLPIDEHLNVLKTL